MSQQQNNSGDHGSHGSGGAHHVTPFKVYYAVWAALIFLTITTVASSYVDFGGPNNILIAMLIATLKGSLVCLYFMGLKYDGAENKVTFFGTFIFLMLFVMLSSADIFFRTDPVEKAKVDSSELAQSAMPVDVNALRLPTPQLLEKGQALFAQNCATCHGLDGKGDGPAAAALKPTPRNFTSGLWKYGGTPAGVFKTITNGVAGTPMPPWSNLSVEDRFALAHYVRHFDPHAPSPAGDTPAVIAALGIGGAPAPRLPLAIAMEKMTQASEPNPHAQGPGYLPGTSASPGARLYAQMCMRCHGARGEGAVAKDLGVSAPLRLSTQPMASYSATLSSQSEFSRTLTAPSTLGLHGYGALSGGEWAELYNYVRGLR